MNLNESITIMTNEITCILTDNKPTVYLFGSVALDDFQLGWSDIDILILTQKEITEQQAETMVELRQVLLERYPGNPYFRLFEGGILSADAFLHSKNERTVYWGTSGQRITDNYKMDSFGMAELLDSGILLCGEDVRNKMTYPTYAQMRDDIVRHVQSARKHGVVVGWLLDIARGLYTLRTGKIITKTAAGEWALDERLCPDADILQKSVQIRKEPLRYSKEDKSVDNAVIQRFADVLEGELANTMQLLAESEDETTDEIMSYINTRNHYDALIGENNDPVRDPIPLKTYMDKWDGEAFIESLLLSPTKSVLEIGVGTGRLAVRVCGKCGRFTGIDLSPKTIDRAKENLREFDHTSLVYGNFLTYSFKERFDIIYSSLTFMHIQNKRAAIQRAANLLSPGGRFVLSIDKNQQTEINYGSRKITVYPDTSEQITTFIAEADLILEKQFETEIAVIFAARKGEVHNESWDKTLNTQPDYHMARLIKE